MQRPPPFKLQGRANRRQTEWQADDAVPPTRSWCGNVPHGTVRALASDIDIGDWHGRAGSAFGPCAVETTESAGAWHCCPHGPGTVVVNAGAAGGGRRDRRGFAFGPNSGARPVRDDRSSTTAGGACGAPSIRIVRQRLLAPAHLPELGRDAPEAFGATGASADGAFAASGSDAGVVETVPAPLPAQERYAAYGSVLGYHTVAHESCGRARLAREWTGRCGTVQRFRLPRRTVAAAGALRCRCMLLARCTMAHGTSCANARGVRTDGAQQQPAGVTGADRVRVEEDIAAAFFVPETAPRPISQVRRVSNPVLPHNSGRALTRPCAVDPGGILRARVVARVTPGVGSCAHQAAAQSG
jgi:hypothetical protein